MVVIAVMDVSVLVEVVSGDSSATVLKESIMGTVAALENHGIL